MYKKILVPLDGSRRAEAILPHVVAIAEKYASEIVLLKIEEPPILLDWDEIIDEKKYRETRDRVKKETRTYMASIENKLKNKGVTNIRSLSRCGSVVKEILSTAEGIDADLLAMASHGHGGTSRVFYGGVSIGVLSQIDRPLLLIRTRHE